MSRFSTRIPVDIKTLLSLLPKGCYVERMVFSHVIDDRNRQQMTEDITAGKIVPEVIVFWDDDRYATPTTLPTDFSVANLKAKTLPKGVRDVVKNPVQKAAPVAPDPEPEPQPEPVRMALLTEQEVSERVKKGEPVQFQGYEPVWKSFDPKEHSFNKSFYYRKPLDKEVQKA